MPGNVKDPLEVNDHEFKVIPTATGVNVFPITYTCVCAGMKRQELCLRRDVLMYDNERGAKELRVYRMEGLG